MKIFVLSLLFCLILKATATGYASYHLYSPGFSLLQCACSDGVNGLITRWQINDLQSLYPYVSAFSMVQWNSPNCGKCIRLENPNNGRVIYVTAIDYCGPPPGGYDAHFDLSPDAFSELFGGTGQGIGSVEWGYADSSSCKGNRG